MVAAAAVREEESQRQTASAHAEVARLQAAVAALRDQLQRRSAEAAEEHQEVGRRRRHLLGDFGDPFPVLYTCFLFVRRRCLDPL